MTGTSTTRLQRQSSRSHTGNFNARSGTPSGAGSSSQTASASTGRRRREGSGNHSAAVAALTSSPPQPPVLDPTSHPSLAAWQRFFAKHQPTASDGHGKTRNREPSDSKSRTKTTPNGKSVFATHVASEAAHEEALRRIRKLTLTHGIPSDEFLTPAGSTYRSVTWKLLLQVRSVSADSYLGLVRRGKSPAFDKIRNDTFRTLATDQGFKRRVHEDKLIRLLNAFVWRHADGQAHATSASYDFSYVQGMNVLAAPFLYVMPSELEAFRCFSQFIEVCCPLYVQPTLAGVHRGLRLLDVCLELADPHLYNYLRSKNLSAEIYAFPSVMTLCACTPPLDQVLQLWDFLLAFGVHLNVLCVVSQLLLMRDDLMHNPSPMRLLRNFPPLEAQPIIGITVTLVRDLPDALYEELVNHTFDPRAVA
ncbi:CDC16 protein [Tilletia horrida]|uniref:CDC16 protein n=1 Tax=Tilletia horrida TaxID=155126 RepID=A0AAN6GVI2_9BASI|nr:CDC16 protein [Tilletia horrida]